MRERQVIISRRASDPIAKLSREVNQALMTKQPLLVAGENIKTINGQSILEGGDIEVTASSNSYFPSGW